MLQRNEFLNWIATDPAWGASDNQKRPLYLGKFLNTDNPTTIEFASIEHLDSLPTLDEIDNHPSLANTNRAYRLHASDNLAVSFDIEPSSDQSYINFYATLPAHYAEYSRNNGIHLYYRVNKNRLSPAALNMVLTATVYKYPNKLDPVTTPKPFEFELLMNNHWVTFTEKTIHNNVLPLSEDAPDEIYQLIEHAASIHQEKVDLSNAVSDITIESTDISKKLATMIRENHERLDAIKDIDEVEYESASSYEFSCALRISYMLLYRLNNPHAYDAMFLETSLTDIDESDKINAVLEVLLEVIPERPKHFNHLINGIPYIMFTCQRAYHTAMSNQS